MTISIAEQIAWARENLATKCGAQKGGLENPDIAMWRAMLATLESCQKWLDYMEQEGGEPVNLYAALTGLPEAQAIDNAERAAAVPEAERA